MTADSSDEVPHYILENEHGLQFEWCASDN